MGIPPDSVDGMTAQAVLIHGFGIVEEFPKCARTGKIELLCRLFHGLD